MTAHIRTGLLLGVAFACSLPLAAGAQDIIKIEEDWQIDVGTPNTSRGSPQLELAMFPTAATDSLACRFLVNKRTYPQGGIGGMQLQITSGDNVFAVGDYADQSLLANTSERIQWTSRMSLSKSVLTFEIVSGSSTTWGKFPGKTALATSVSTTLSNLNAYDPNNSAANASIDFGLTRVQKLTLRKVRSYTNGSKSIEKALDRVIYQYP